MAKPELTVLTSPEGLRMLSNVTDGFYDNSYIGLWLYQVMGIEIDEMRLWSDEIRYEAFPQTATWSLACWEFTYGLETDESLSVEYRRQRILAKIIERAPMNPERMRHIVETISGTNVKVYENIMDYTFLVILLPNNKPINYKEIYRCIKKIKPSHLAWILVEKIEPALVSNNNIVSLHRLSFHVKLSFYKKGILLDGKYLLDNTWKLQSKCWGSIDGFKLLIQSFIQNRNFSTAAYRLLVNSKTKDRTKTRFKVLAAVQTKYIFKLFRPIYSVAIQNKETLSACLTEDTMWRLNGLLALNAERKLNAAIKLSVL